jgi:hypothetical protein
MITATGAEEIALVAAAVRSMGSDRKIVNDMAREIRKGIPPIRKAIKVNVVEYLPSGLGPWVNKARVTGVIKRSATSAGVTIRMGRNSDSGKRSDLKRLDSAGRIRHPTGWGDHKVGPWAAQTVRPNSISDGITQEGADQLEQAVIAAADNAARRILYA